jgi:2'-5' RNA ligase
MSTLKDHMIILNLPKIIKDHVKLYKHGAGEFIGNYASLNSTAHISLSHTQKLSLEVADTYTKLLQRKINNMSSINLTINGFKYFVHSNDLTTIYANIQSCSATECWFNTLRMHLNLNNNSFVPHITITKTIPVDSFYKLWPQFKLANFITSFVPASVAVLEREHRSANYKWNLRNELYFNGMGN